MHSPSAKRKINYQGFTGLCVHTTDLRTKIIKNNTDYQKAVRKRAGDGEGIEQSF